MQALNLTNSQKELLRWLVEQERFGNLDEEVIWSYWMSGSTELAGKIFRRTLSLLSSASAVLISSSYISDGETIKSLYLVGYKGEGEAPKVQKANLDALCENGYLCCDRTRYKYTCALTGRAYKAVDSNFDAPDTSAILYLSALPPGEYLDSELWERCRYSLSVGGNNPKAWDKAVRTATVVLEDRLRRYGQTERINPDATGEGIVNLIFGRNSVLKDKLDEKQIQAYRSLYAGMMAVFRNPYAHRFVDPSPEEGGAIIVFIDLLLKMLDDIDWDSEGSAE